MAKLNASPEIVELMEQQSAEINRFAGWGTALADEMGAGHLECAEKIRALRNPKK